MLYTRLCASAMLSICAVGCGPSVQLPAVEPEEVKLYLAGERPDEEYEVIKKIEERARGDVENSVLIIRARLRASKLGADALIVEEIRTKTMNVKIGGAESEPTIEMGPAVEKIMKSVAIYFPGRHPELKRDR